MVERWRKDLLGSSKEEGGQLWQILVETVHSLPMYKNHKRYAEENLLKERPEISPKELAIQMNISLGEALVMVSEIRGVEPEIETSKNVPTASKSKERSLLDFSG